VAATIRGYFGDGSPWANFTEGALVPRIFRNAFGADVDPWAAAARNEPRLSAFVFDAGARAAPPLRLSLPRQRAAALCRAVTHSHAPKTPSTKPATTRAEASWFNHSCRPNAHVTLLGGKLVARAGARIPAGAEVDVSYIGPLVFAPLSVRGDHIRAAFKFECQCSRCVVEASAVGDGLAEAADEVAEAMASILPPGRTVAQALADAGGPGPLGPQLEEVNTLLARYRACLDAAVPDAEVASGGDAQPAAAAAAAAQRKLLADLRAMLWASVYPGLSLAYQARAWGGAAAPAMAASLLAAVRAVGPGSPEHVTLALDALARAEPVGGDLAAAARAELEEAMAARYGPLSEDGARALMAAGARVAAAGG
jgi:hypothetical protein